MHFLGRTYCWNAENIVNLLWLRCYRWSDNMLFWFRVMIYDVRGLPFYVHLFLKKYPIMYKNMPALILQSRH